DAAAQGCSLCRHNGPGRRQKRRPNPKWREPPISLSIGNSVFFARPRDLLVRCHHDRLPESDRGLIDMSGPPEGLLIEDDLQIRRFLRTTLAAEHYRLCEATTATEGIKLAAERSPDVIVLDLGLPDADGVEVIRSVRQGNRNLPIVVLSARSNERDKI